MIRMSRKHFNVIALALQTLRNNTSESKFKNEIEETIMLVGILLMKTNDKFDQKRFLKVCGLLD